MTLRWCIISDLSHLSGNCDSDITAPHLGVFSWQHPQVGDDATFDFMKLVLFQVDGITTSPTTRFLHKVSHIAAL